MLRIRGTTSRSWCSRIPWHEHMFAWMFGRIRTGSTNWGAGIRTEIAGTKTQSPAIGRPPKGRCWPEGRYYDASGARAHGDHRRRRRRNAHALQAAEGPPSAVRPRTDPVARHRGPRGRRRQGRGRGQPEAAARRSVARGHRDRRCRSSRRAPATRSPPRPPPSHRGRRHGRDPLRRRPADQRAEAIGDLVKAHDDSEAACDDGDDGTRQPRPVRPRRPRQAQATSKGRRGQGGGRREARAARDPRGQHRASTPSTAAALLDGAAARSTRDNAQGELYLPDVLPKLREAGQDDRTRTSSRTTTLTLGVNDRVDLAQRAPDRPEAVSTTRHARTASRSWTRTRPGWIDADVTIGLRHRLSSPSTLPPRGATTIGADCAIGPLDHDHRLGARRRRVRAALLPGAGERWTITARSARSPTCARTPTCTRTPRPEHSWRSRTPRSARARRCRT